MGKGPSVIVAVEPVVLEGALAFLIERAEHCEVVPFHGTEGALGRRYDAAVVSSPGPLELQASVVIRLPAAGVGKASVTKDDETTWAIVESHHDVLQLLAEHVPTANGSTTRAVHRRGHAGPAA